MKCPSQRHRSRETAIERSTETARQRQLRAPLVSLLEPIFEEDAIEARFFAKMKDEADLEIRRREASKELFLVDFEKGIDDRRGDVTVEQGLVGSPAAISSRPLKAVSSCLCRQGLSVAVPF